VVAGRRDGCYAADFNSAFFQFQGQRLRFPAQAPDLQNITLAYTDGLLLFRYRVPGWLGLVAEVPVRRAIWWELISTMRAKRCSSRN
jgi:hypothetical protein